ncbi:hypothetical protein C1H46_004810 [Malus baccata]|uniref:NADH:quinone oxidoreductase/Mrp antiporter membrane subunit domain-containing protein n=1 Tax=Malus baccata TaxID=106549 RepID=A0A540NEZ0_MALBA|nr:hypothetical protein C1H46_004810 [Malus baccata]
MKGHLLVCLPLLHLMEVEMLGITGLPETTRRERLILLRLIKSPYQGPDETHRGFNVPDQSRSALVLSRYVPVVVLSLAFSISIPLAFPVVVVPLLRIRPT